MPPLNSKPQRFSINIYTFIFSPYFVCISWKNSGSFIFFLIVNRNHHFFLMLWLILSKEYLLFHETLATILILVRQFESTIQLLFSFWFVNLRAPYSYYSHFGWSIWEHMVLLEVRYLCSIFTILSNNLVWATFFLLY